MNQTYPREYKRTVNYLTPKNPKTFSENMKKLRSPFLCDENFTDPLKFKSKKEKLELKVNVTQQDFKRNDVSEAGLSNTNNLEEETENSFSIKNDFEKDFERHFKRQCTATTYDKNTTFNTNLNKRLDIRDSANAIETSAVSDYCTDESEIKTNNFLESDTSIESFSLSEPLKPFKNSTFIIQEEINKCERKENETFIFDANREITEIEADSGTNNDLDFIKRNSLSQKNTIQVPSITVNEEKIISETFEKKESKMANLSENEENKNLKSNIIQIELFKQIEIKDKVMSHLLELSHLSEFPKLKHLCCSLCEKDNEGVCKKIKRFENDTKLQEEHYGILKYLWSSIKYPFTPVSPATQIKVEGIVRRKPFTKPLMQLKNKKENSFNLEDHKHKRNDMETNPSKITDFVLKNQKNALNKSNTRKKFHLFRNGEKSEINMDKEENNRKFIHKKGTNTIQSVDNKFVQMKRSQYKISEEDLKKFHYFTTIRYKRETTEL